MNTRAAQAMAGERASTPIRRSASSPGGVERAMLPGFFVVLVDLSFFVVLIDLFFFGVLVDSSFVFFL